PGPPGRPATGRIWARTGPCPRAIMAVSGYSPVPTVRREWNERPPMVNGVSCIVSTAVETMQDTPFTIGGRSFHSRLMVGTGKYPDTAMMARGHGPVRAQIRPVAGRPGGPG